MKRLALSFASIALVSIFAIGATSAYFTYQTTATGNTFAAGTLRLNLNNKNGFTRAYSVDNIAPGDRYSAGKIILKNAGSVNGHVWLEIKNVETTGDGTLGNLIRASFKKDIAGWNWNWDRDNTRFGGKRSLNDSQDEKIDLFDLKAGASVPLFVYVTWPNGTPATDNPAQGQTTTFDIVFHLDQKMR